MVYINVRQTVADYAKWRAIFDNEEPHRKAGGATGVKQVYRDVDDSNVVTIVVEWNNAEDALKFTKDPELAEVMQKAGVIGRPALMAIMSQV
jgi:hypothetical protein